MSPQDAAIVAKVPRYFRGRWLQGYARGKLKSDPVYRASYEMIGKSALPLLDVGCGMGLHAFDLRERGYTAPITGLDVDKRKIADGQRAIEQGGYKDVTLSIGDGAALPSFSGHVSMLDVLHYFPADQQPDVLSAMAERVAPGGWCIIRTTPRDGTWRYRMTQAEELFARCISWMACPAIAFPTLTSVQAQFPADKFEHDVRPLWGRTPFNSWLLAFRRRS
jgi:SAM-dependent methyltransferase